MADIFADEGTTGTSVKKRADFMRMMKWCKQDKIDLILTKSVSRFARNTVDCLNYVRMLKAQGIAVYFEKENINSMDESTELMLTMMGAFAQAESESISGNIQAGKRYAMQRGEATINYYNLYAYSRFDYGKKYCHDSPSVDEQQLQQAILRVINSIMTDKPTLVRQVTENLQVVIRPSRSGELTIADIDHQLEVLAREFDTAFVAAASGNSEDYSERFKTILAQQAELKAKRVELERQQAEDAELNSHMEEATDIMGQAGTAITEERTATFESCGIGQNTLQGRNTGSAEKRDRENRKTTKVGCVS